VWINAVMAWFHAARRANAASFEEIRESFSAADRLRYVVIAPCVKQLNSA
jgi:hypothetical protein